MHEYQDCPANTEIENLKNWQNAQNGHLRNIDSCLGDLVKAEARRAGAEAMLKWILGLVGFTGFVSIVSLLVGVMG